MKRLCSVFLSFVMLWSIVCSCGIRALAFPERGTCGEKVTYTFSGGTLTFSGTGKMQDYTADTAPFRGTAVKKVIVGDGIANVGSYVLAGCSSLTSVALPISVRTVERGAFRDCTSLTNITVPYKVTALGEDAFSGCRSLKSILLSKRLERVEKNAFFGCSSLTNVNYPGKAEAWDALLIAREGNDALTQAKLTYQYHIAEKSWLLQPATFTQSGYIRHICAHCGDAYNTAIPLLWDYRPAVERYVYDGKEKRSPVIIRDRNGKRLPAGNYSVTYKNNRQIGKATAQVALKGNYSGSFSYTYFIVPKGTALSSVKGQKKAFTVKWKKQTTNTSGYQIQYADNKNFKKSKNITVNGNKKLSKTVKKLARKKVYYVRVRTYKTVGKIRYVSSWSATKAVKTK